MLLQACFIFSGVGFGWVCKWTPVQTICAWLYLSAGQIGVIVLHAKYSTES